MPKSTGALTFVVLQFEVGCTLLMGARRCRFFSEDRRHRLRVQLHDKYCTRDVVRSPQQRDARTGLRPLLCTSAHDILLLTACVGSPLSTGCSKRSFQLLVLQLVMRAQLPQTYPFNKTCFQCFLKEPFHWNVGDVRMQYQQVTDSRRYRLRTRVQRHVQRNSTNGVKSSKHTSSLLVQYGLLLSVHDKNIDCLRPTQCSTKLAFIQQSCIDSKCLTMYGFSQMSVP